MRIFAPILTTLLLLGFASTSHAQTKPKEDATTGTSTDVKTNRAPASDSDDDGMNETMQRNIKPGNGKPTPPPPPARPAAPKKEEKPAATPQDGKPN